MRGAADGWLERLRVHGLLVLIVSVTVLLSLSATMINVAVPVIVRDLGASAVEGNWLLLSYLLVHTCMLVLGGQVSDGSDKRVVFLVGLGVFVLGAVVLVVAWHPLVFIAARAAQGAGAALLLSNAAAILAWTYSGPGLRRAMGLYLAGFAVAQASGPVVGGVLASTVGWRSMFVVTVVVGLVSLLVGRRLLRRLPAGPSPGRPWIDIPGNVVLALSLASGLVGLTSAQARGWNDPVVLGLLMLSVILLPVLWRVERGRSDPAVDPALIVHPVFGPVNVAAMILNVPRVVPIALLSLWFQGVEGLTTVRAGLLITALPLGVAAGSVLLRRVAGRRDDRDAGLRTAVMAALACTALPPALLWGTPGALAVVLLLMGVATGMYSTASATTLLNVAPRDRAATANGIRTTFQLVGLAGGTAALLSIVTAGLSSSQATLFMGGRSAALSGESLSTLREAYVLGFGGVAVLTWVAVLLSFRVYRDRPRPTNIR